jgi:hypothetical protein
MLSRFNTKVPCNNLNVGFKRKRKLLAVLFFNGFFNAVAFLTAWIPLFTTP